jgi:hypothetical protein
MFNDAFVIEYEHLGLHSRGFRSRRHIGKPTSVLWEELKSHMEKCYGSMSRSTSNSRVDQQSRTRSSCFRLEAYRKAASKDKDLLPAFRKASTKESALRGRLENIIKMARALNEESRFT